MSVIKVKLTEGNSAPPRIAIQGEPGSNSHLAAVSMLGAVELVPCAASATVVDAVVAGDADAAVLPIENSLHGSVAEHYDLLLEQSVRIDHELSLRVRHNVIAAPGVRPREIVTLLSHPVALSQCRNWIVSHPQIRAVPFYDTAGSVKHVIAGDLRDTAAVAPELAAEVYGGVVLAKGIEDHAQNYTRFHLLLRAGDARPEGLPAATKLSAAFAVEHKPGTLVHALQALADEGANLTKIESRPVPGTPWEYVFYVDLRFDGEPMADRALTALHKVSSMVKELGRYGESTAE